jgi:hypothetical protein
MHNEACIKISNLIIKYYKLCDIKNEKDPLIQIFRDQKLSNNLHIKYISVSQFFLIRILNH